MATFICLVSFTEEGFRNLKETRRRADAFKQSARKKGISITHTYWTIGRYDILHIFEAPDVAAAASVAFALGSMGNVRTETLRAFNRDEMAKVLSDAYDMHTADGSLTFEG